MLRHGSGAREIDGLLDFVPWNFQRSKIVLDEFVCFFCGAILNIEPYARTYGSSRCFDIYIEHGCRDLT